MSALIQTEFDYSFYKFKQNSSSGSFSIGDYEYNDLGSSSTSIISIDSDLKKKSHAQNSIWDDFQEVLKNVPQNELENLPSDAATEIDHYLYGTPKRKS